MALVMILLIVLGIVVLPSPRLLEPVSTFCHLTDQADQQMTLFSGLLYM